MLDVKNNIKNISNQRKYQAEFETKLKEIKENYFVNSECKDNLRRNFDEFYLLLEDEDMDENDVYEMTNDILDRFKEDLKSLRRIREKY